MTDSFSAAPESFRPTHCRWYIVAAATMMSILLYLDRFCISFALTFIQEDLGIDSINAGYVKSSFFLAYALFQIPSGWFSDRWGGRLMLAIYILTWSLFTYLIGWSASLWFLLLMQLGHGACQAGAYPTSAGLLSQWMPLSTRGMASSIVAFGGRAGAFLAPILTAWLIVVFVPTETSSQLVQGTIKSSKFEYLCLQLAPEDSPSTQPKPTSSRELRQAIWEHLPADSQLAVKRCVSEAGERKVIPLEVSILTDGLNQVLRVPNLASADSLRQINIAREGAALMARRDAGQTLATPEVERLNRLVLEALAPDAIGKIYVQGWRKVFTVYGIAGMIAAALFWIIVRNRPQEHPWCNSAELARIQEGREAAASAVSAAPPKLNWGRLLRSPGIWLSSISQFATNVGWIFIALQLPEYLEKIHHVEIIQRGYLTAFPMAGGVGGMLLGGRLTDWMQSRWGLRWGRAIPMGLTKFGAAAAFIGCIFAPDPWTATTLCALAAFFTDLGVAATWAFVQDASGRYVGVVLGFGNMWGNFGATVGPTFFAYTLEWTRGSWNTCFLICAAAMLVSAVSGLMIDATRQIVDEK